MTAHTQGKPRALLTVTEAVAASHNLVSRNGLYSGIRSGELPSSRPARRRIIRAEDLARWLGVKVEDLALPDTND